MVVLLNSGEPEDLVRAAEAGADEVGLSDTTGLANPAQVRRLFTRLCAELGIVADVAARGDAALIELSLKFDRVDLGKLGLRDRVQVVVSAYEHGLVGRD